MKSLKNLLTVLLALFISFLIQSISFAETVPPITVKKDVMSKPVLPATVKKNVVPKSESSSTIKKQVIQNNTSEEGSAINSGLCACFKEAEAINVIQKSYVSLQEDEWPAAIKTTKDAINTINTLWKNCACPETIAYQKIAEAYLKYAEGGDHLDGAGEPNCPFATKLYSDAITLLDNYIPKISNPAVKENAEDIKGYVQEEKEFVDEECNGTQSQEKSKGASKEKK